MQPFVTAADPERFILVARRVEDGRFLFAQWGDWPHPTMISTLPPSEHEGFVEGIESLLRGRMHVRVVGTPQLATERVAVRMAHPRGGGPMLGWLQPVAVEVSGEPAPDALIEGVAALSLDEALDTLATDVERAAFRAGAEAFEAFRYQA
ncbi:MAG: hypothetical protein WCI61_11175 [Chloroflexota bacterium]